MPNYKVLSTFVGCKLVKETGRCHHLLHQRGVAGRYNPQLGIIFK